MICPYCQSEINDRAIKCKFCNSKLLDKKKDHKKDIFKAFLNFLSVFFGVVLALIVVMIFAYKYYFMFQVKYDHKSKNECYNNIRFLEEVLPFYEARKGETIKEFSENNIKKIKDELGEENFELPKCNLDGHYIIYKKNRVKCSIHGELQ